MCMNTKHARRLAIAAALAAATAAGLATATTSAAAASACANGGITSYSPPPSTDKPFGITAGPGGTWYSEGNRIVRVQANGRIDQFLLPDAADAGWLTWPGGDVVWFSDRGTGRLGTVDGSGHVVEYQVPGVGASPNGQVAVDSIVWFTDSPTNRIGRLDPATGQFTMFSVPTAGSWPLGITAGPDGAIWFTERLAAKVARMSTDGTFTEWDLTPGAFPNRIVVGPDGAIWFTELRAGQIARITTAGTLTQIPIDGGPVGITLGPDGNLYVALWTSQQLGRLDPSGHLTNTWNVPGALTVGSSRGDLWVADPFHDSVASVHVTCGG
jgi:virginiamycin B lyase